MIFSRDKVHLLFTPQDAVVPAVKHLKNKKIFGRKLSRCLMEIPWDTLFIPSEPFLFLLFNLSLKAFFFIMRIYHFHPCVTVSFSTVSGSPNILVPHSNKERPHFRTLS